MPTLRNTCRVCRRCTRRAVVIRLGRRMWFLVNCPGWLGGLPLECLIAFGGGIDRLRDVYPRVVSDSRVRSGNLDLVVVPLDIPLVECYVTRHQVDQVPFPHTMSRDLDAYPSVFWKRAMLLGMSTGEAIPSSILARNCFWASNPVPALRIFDRV